MERFVFSAAILLHLQGFLASPILAAPDLKNLDAFIRQRMEQAHIPGLAIAVVHSGEVVYCQGFGRSGSAGDPVSSTTPFVLGATSRSFTALMVMQLVEEGRVDLDAPVVRYIPWFRVGGPDSGARITVRQLLIQTSGFPGAAGLESLTDDDHGSGALERLTRSLARTRLNRPPGQSFEYSIANDTVLGMLVETLEGRPFSECIQERILGPLDMKNTFVSIESARERGLATGHRYSLGRAVEAPALPWSAGLLPSRSLISSARDLGLYLTANLDAGTGSDSPVLSPEGFAELFRPQGVVGPAASSAMGWARVTRDGIESLAHGGPSASYLSFLCMLPEEDIGIAILTNVSGYLLPEERYDFPVAVLQFILGHDPGPRTIGWISWAVYGALLFLVLAQLVGFLLSLWLLRPTSRTHPRTQGGWTRRIWIWAVADLVLLLVLVAGVPWMIGAPVSLMWLVQPDATLTLGIVTMFTAVWAPIRTIVAGLRN